MSPAISRIAFCMYILKFVGTSRTKRHTFHFIIVSQLVVNLGTMIEVLVSCERFEQLWDFRIHGRCWSPKIQAYLGFFQGGEYCRSVPDMVIDVRPAWNSTTDLLLTFLPIMILRNLNMEQRTRIALCMVMGLSFGAMIACIVKTIELKAIGDRVDFTYSTTGFVIWFTIEQYIVIIAASIPTIRPLALRLARRHRSRASPRSFRDSPRRPSQTPGQNSSDLSWSNTTPLNPVRLLTPVRDNAATIRLEDPYVHSSPQSPPPSGCIRKTISIVIESESSMSTGEGTGQPTATSSPARFTTADSWPFPEACRDKGERK
jgi:hypothetical protein